MLKKLFCLLIIQTAHLQATHTYGNLIVKELINVHDGDTFKVNISNVHPIVGEGILVRIKKIDTPEITSKKPKVKALALKVRDYVTNRLMGSKKIELIDVQRDKYFRILADVKVDGADLAEELINAGYAKPYDGGTKPTW